MQAMVPGPQLQGNYFKAHHKFYRVNPQLQLQNTRTQYHQVKAGTAKTQNHDQAAGAVAQTSAASGNTKTHPHTGDEILSSVRNRQHNREEHQ
ncbi:hypothetical protein Nepgr_023069 [Nepenthes gracilis]|uniref:Uncharacterized protein n=1 Tax=Nepenthes gracilis TaxID=150966 RepID=A0AAD3T375_NEPGR|nr:hypothetical protein Nepgr_023069 [Nepenthes gracilis]